MGSNPLSPAGYRRLKDGLFADPDRRIAAIALLRRYVTQEQFDGCQGQPGLLTELLVQRGFLDPARLRELEQTEEAPPARIGKYLLVREIARGGMGIVYEAEDPELRRRVALKILKEGEDDPDFVARLHREASIAAQLAHPNIVGVHEVGMIRKPTGEPVHFIAMDYIDGTTLAAILQEKSSPRRELLRMLEEVSQAVAYAHSKGVIHRDLKPSNVLVEKSGRILLTDFGLARAEGFKTRLTRSKAVIGTPQYMAPEQVEGNAAQIDAKTDVYGLGVMLYEILTARPPFLAETPARLYEQILRVEPERPSRRCPGLDAELEVICLKAMEKSRDHRTPTALEFAEDLRRFREGEPIRARPLPAWRRTWMRMRRQKTLSAAVAGLVGVALFGALALVFLAIRHQRRIEVERALGQRREAALKRLATQWSTIVERNRELRQGRVPVNRGRSDLADAVRETEAYLREWPDDPQGYYVRARGRMYLGDWEGAETDLRSSVAKRTDFRPGWSLLGIVHVERGQNKLYGVLGSFRERVDRLTEVLNEAQTAFQRGWESGREREESERWGLPWTREDRVMERMARALILRYVERRESEAQAVLETALEEYQSEEYANLLGNWAGWTAENIRWQTRAIEWAPGYSRAYFDRAEARRALGDLAGAREDYDQSLLRQPDDAEAYNNRGTLRHKQDDVKGAMEDYDSALRIRPDLAETYSNRGIVKRESGDWAGAMADQDQAIQLRPNFAEAYHNRAGLKKARGDLSGALSDYDRAIEFRDDFAEAHNDRGTTRQALGDWTGAVTDFTRALELREDIPEAYVNRGDTRMLLEDWKAAIGDYDHAIALKKDYVEAYHGRGVVKHRRKDLAGARSDFDRAIELRPGFADAYNNRALVRWTQGDFAGATADFTRAIDLSPDNPDSYVNRGLLHQSQNELREAVEDFEATLRVAPPNWPSRAQVEARLAEVRAKIR